MAYDTYQSRALRDLPSPSDILNMAIRSSSFRQTALAAVVILLSSVPTSHAFVSNNIIRQSSYSTKQTTSTSINIFGGLKDAFGNDDSLGKAKDAGLSNGPKYNDQVTV